MDERCDAESYQFGWDGVHAVSRSIESEERESNQILKMHFLVWTGFMDLASRGDGDDEMVGQGEMIRLEQRPDEREITADEFVRLVNSVTTSNQGRTTLLVSLVLCEMNWTALRRRQLSFLPNQLSNLTSFTLSARPETPFIAGTLERLISPLNQLKSLALRGIEFSKHSVSGITPPSFELQSLALLDVSNLNAKHLRWL